MKQLAAFAAFFFGGYLLATKAMPYVQAKFESLNLDEVWDVWDTEEWM